MLHCSRPVSSLPKKELTALTDEEMEKLKDQLIKPYNPHIYKGGERGYPNSSLADLYDELTMPPELRKAHQENDKVVMAAYGWSKKDAAYSSESACVAELMKMYQRLINAN